MSQISSTVGESPESTKAALGTAIPAVLGSLMGKANASPDGATQIFNALKQDQGGWMNSISSFLGGGAGAQQAQSGMGSLLNSILGPKLGPVAEFISGHCGIKNSSAMSLLGMAAPLVMGTLSKHVSSQGLGAAGLGQLLSSQAENLKGVLPPGLANTMGIGSLLSGANQTTRVATEAAGQARQAYASATAPATAGRGSALKWAVPLLIVAALALFAVSHNSEKTPAVGGAEDTVQSQAGRAAASMPDLSSLNLQPGSIGDKIAKAISSGNISQKFDMQGLTFDSTGNLTQTANTQVQQIASILKAAPNLSIAITCYGSSADDGKSKADSIKSILTSTGISSERVLARGEQGSGVPSVRLMK
jgi:hypothetical protein